MFHRRTIASVAPHHAADDRRNWPEDYDENNKPQHSCLREGVAAASTGHDSKEVKGRELLHANKTITPTNRNKGAVNEEFNVVTPRPTYHLQHPAWRSAQRRTHGGGGRGGQNG